MKSEDTKYIDKLKEALKKDFRTLYVKEFTTDWGGQRMVRELEIDVMGIDNLEAFLLKTIEDVRSTQKQEMIQSFKEMIGKQKLVINKGEHCETCGGYNASNGSETCSCVIRNNFKRELRQKLQMLEKEKGGEK